MRTVIPTSAWIVFVVTLSAGAAMAVPSTIASTGEIAPGTSNEWVILLEAKSNDSHFVGFRGLIEIGPNGVDNLTDEGIWLDTTGSPDLIIQGGDTVSNPPGAVIATFLSGPAKNASGEIAFNGRMVLGPGGVTTANWRALFGPDGSGGIGALVQEGDPMPGGGFFTSHAAQRLDPLGRVYFQTFPDVFWVVSAGQAPVKLVDQGLLVESGPDILGDPADTHISENGRLVFVEEGGVGGLFTTDASGFISRVAAPGDLAPGTPHEFSNFYDPEINDAGEIAVLARLTDGVLFQGIALYFVDALGSFELVARETESAPGTSRSFETLSTTTPTLSLNQAGQVLFTANLTGNVLNDDGVWQRDSDGSVSLLLLEGTPVPDRPGVDFLRPNLVFQNDAGDALIKSFSGALYSVGAGGNYETIWLAGETLEVFPGDVRTISDSLPTEGIDDFALLYNFTDGSAAYVVETIPEPRGGTVVLLTLALLAWRERRTNPR